MKFIFSKKEVEIYYPSWLKSSPGKIIQTEEGEIISNKMISSDDSLIL